MSRTACTEPQCLYSRAIPLLPLRAVWPVQSLSACTRVHFAFNFLDGLMSVVLSRAEIRVPYGEVVGDNEFITLYPRCRTNRGRYKPQCLYKGALYQSGNNSRHGNWDHRYVAQRTRVVVEPTSWNGVT
jgi:hypothetical protein